MKTTKKLLKLAQTAHTLAISVVFFTACGLLSTTAHAQVEQKQTKSEEVLPARSDTSILKQEERRADEVVFTVVEEIPEFPGGDEARIQFIADNLKYPEEAVKSGVEGRVFVIFVIEADGSVTNANVLRGIGGGCDEEAIRVVESMPKWIPGKQRGAPVRVQFNMPIHFSLEKEEKIEPEERKQPAVPEFRRLPVPEEAPSFPGGETAKMAFINKNLRYPAEAKKQGIEGTVYLNFTVETDGAISDVKVLRGIGGGCDEEAVRVVEAMPKWNPSKKAGRTEKTQSNLPIRFDLAKDERKEE